MPEKRWAWGCEFKCGKVAATRQTIERHEKTCFNNPARRSCKLCIYRDDNLQTVDDDSPDGFVNVCAMLDPVPWHKDAPEPHRSRLKKHAITWGCPQFKEDE